MLVATRISEPGQHCPLCKKTFVKESTRKRHYYYCRSRRPDTNASRRRSCTACVRAKTRCTGLVNSSLKICIRCNERGTKCDYDTASRPDLVSGQDYISRRSSRDTGIQRSTTSSIVNGGFDLTEDWPVSMHVQKYQDLPSTFDTLLDNNWDANLGDLDTLDLENQVTVGNQAIDPVPSTMSTLSDTLVTGISSLEPKTFQFSSPYPFNFRTVAKPSHIPLVSLATRILRSYPFMILQDGALPPFLSPQMYAWARAGTGPQQQTLLNCVSLVQIFKSRTEANKDLIWGLIRSEQERIFVEYLGFDQWELLAALQALLFYCLLRLQDDPEGQDGFDASLLNTVNLVSGALSLLVKCDCSLPTDPNLAWRDWIFNESRRRTALVFRAINMLVDISTAMTCYPASGFDLIPLPSKTTLWNPRDVDKWRTAFEQCCKERTLFGLSEAGTLMKLQQNESGIQQSVGQWEEWTAEVGDIGTLAMVMGDLLS